MLPSGLYHHPPCPVARFAWRVEVAQMQLGVGLKLAWVDETFQSVPRGRCPRSFGDDYQSANVSG